jgi:formate hydrogenlyase transcriptional activator
MKHNSEEARPQMENVGSQTNWGLDRTSERQHFEIARQLEIEKARLIEAQAVANIGSWETELPGLEVTWSEQTHRIFETDPLHFRPRRPDFLKLVHPEDRVKVDAAYEASLERSVSSNIEYRIVLADGRVKVLEEHWKVFQDEQGRPVRLVGTCQDISERKRLRDQLQLERDRLRLLIDLNLHFISKLDICDFFDVVAASLRRVEGWESATILLPDLSTRELRIYLNEGGDPPLKVGTLVPLDSSVAGKVYQSGQPFIFCFDEPATECSNTSGYQDIVSAGLKTGWALPLIQDGRVFGVLVLATRRDQESATRDLSFLQELARLIATSLSNALRYEQVNSSRARLFGAKNCIEDQIRVEFSFETIVGASGALRNVLQQVETVAPTDSNVLILGETGTGKELIARAIHDRSLRCDQNFIKVDCSAIPGALMESELFGHEKGAFTGAISQRLGRFEIADKGTLFLDEVGDIPTQLQPKLLRVLQERALERLGSNRTRQLDVRIVAATNRNLEKMVEEGDFREDLYYRVKVFPITIPPLRERPEDIPSLVQHYMAKYSQRMKKEIPTVAQSSMEMFRRYPWPGNVRELQHFIERSVILTSGRQLQAPLSELQHYIRRQAIRPSAAPRKLEDIERESIVQALEESHWVVGGPNGAAVKLGLKRTTLASRLEKLGISRPRR